MLICQDVGERIKNLREASGLTQHQIADYLGMDQSLLSRVEKNERQMNLEALDKLTNLFGCSIQYNDAISEERAPLKFAFRASEISSEDFETLAAINKIALNLSAMNLLLGGEPK